MANTKISELTSATTPLAGTETLPIVQSSTTKQVSVANLTAGRAVNVSTLTATGTISTTGTSSYFRGLAGASVLLQNSNATANWQLFPNGTTTDFYLNSAQNGNFVIQNPVNIQADTTLTSANLVQGTSGKGINFTANTPAAGKTSQLLNWYEEGTWTMGLSFGGGTTGITYVVNTGRYIRIGKSVTVTGLLILSSKGSSTGAVKITGLPFSIGAGNESQSAGAIRLGNSTFTGQYAFTGSNGTTTIDGQVDNGTTGTAASLTNTNFANNSLIQISYTYFVD